MCVQKIGRSKFASEDPQRSRVPLRARPNSKRSSSRSQKAEAPQNITRSLFSPQYLITSDISHATHDTTKYTRLTGHHTATTHKNQTTTSRHRGARSPTPPDRSASHRSASGSTRPRSTTHEHDHCSARAHATHSRTPHIRLHHRHLTPRHSTRITRRTSHTKRRPHTQSRLPTAQGPCTCPASSSCTSTVESLAAPVEPKAAASHLNRCRSRA